MGYAALVDDDQHRLGLNQNCTEDQERFRTEPSKEPDSKPKFLANAYFLLISCIIDVMHEMSTDLN